MIRSLRLCFSALAAAAAASLAHTPAFAGDLLATGQTVTPTAAPGSQLIELAPGLQPVAGVTMLQGNGVVTSYVAGQPEATVTSPDGNTLLVMTTGYNGLADVNGNVVYPYSNEYVFVYDISRDSPALQQVLPVPFTYDGIAFAPDGNTFYVSGGVEDIVHVFKRASGTWAETSAPIPLKDTPTYASGAGSQAAGLAVNSDGSRLVVANYESDSISVIDTSAGAVVAVLDLRPGKIDPSKAGVPGGEFPYWVAIKSKSTAYVSSLRDREIVVVDFSKVPAQAAIVTARIPVAGNPNRLILNKSQSRLYVASDNSDTVTIIDTRHNRVVASVNTAAPESLLSAAPPRGNSPDALALSPDERTLYVTNGGANSVAVIDVGDDDEPRVRGLIPTGWYPNSVSVSADGKMLYIADGKSLEGPNTTNCTQTFNAVIAAHYVAPGCSVPSDWDGAGNSYRLQLSKGGLLTVPVPDEGSLAALTQQVAQNNGFQLTLTGAEQQTLAAVASKIKHVVYIIKENRTYDQILGDLTPGNGDPTINQFPQPITPNFHKIASQFVTLDNFYDSGDVSMDGWQWSTAARTSDGNEKAYIVNYAGRGLSYDSEGDARGSISVAQPTIALRQSVDPRIPNDPDLLPGPRNEVELDGPGGQIGAGYLWDAVLRAGKTVRDYGMFADVPAGVPNQGDPRSAGTKVAVPSNVALQSNTDLYYYPWNTCIPDFWREHEWETEYDQFVAASKSAGHDEMPSLELVRMPQDHMGCIGSGVDHADTPERQQADNDYAVGRLLEKVSKGPFADSTIVFVVEDDAQDGPDHVDARRSTGYVAGAYVKHGAVVSTHYATTNVLRTIEDLLGLEHLNLHDGGVKPMIDVLDPNRSEWHYHAVPSFILRAETTLPLPPPSDEELALAPVHSLHNAHWWADALAGFDFSREDRNNADRFNRVLWRGLMGDKPYPTVRSGSNAAAISRN
jgi:YVTN family beta-propeller protein